ncbi:fibrobacter succinogenes major paralogous domain-containing protein [Chryseobacterium fistulae]|uniref:fibrobacter succinogenes major paralogous domain-containing protein n=1 Tax=Chryseobacterium fistulae TaxID=2675058 RepID=UPI001E5192D6|nr:fibrobacter succinogenes major paralogous domain-containing protein [Chryseobacterium fistulae]
MILLSFGNLFYSQIRVVGNTPNPNQEMGSTSAFIDGSSQSDLNATTNVGKGIAFPRTDLSTFTSFAGSITGIPTSFPYFFDGLIVYNTAISGVAGVGSTEGTLCRGFWYYDNPQASGATISTTGTWRPMRPDLCLLPPFELKCTVDKVDTGTLIANAPAAGNVSTQISYSNGNGMSYSGGETFESMAPGVTGLTATLVGGTLANGDGKLTFQISGTPSGAGTATFPISFGGSSCSFTRAVDPASPIMNVDCTGSGRVDTGTLTANTPAAGNVSSQIPYTGGNGVSYPGGQEIHSTGVTGLIATLVPQSNPPANGILTFQISGTPSGAGTASFLIEFGGSTCTFTRTVANGLTVTMCDGRTWLRHNVGANTSLDPDSPVQGTNGNYFQWGYNNVVATPTTPSGDHSGMSVSANTNNFAWTNNSGPCPSGFRVPTTAEWNALVQSSSLSSIGSRFVSATNFGSATVLTCSNGNKLTLPTTGWIQSPGGILNERGRVGYYWTSTAVSPPPNQAYHAESVYFPETLPASGQAQSFGRIDAATVRCINQ